MFRKIFFYLIHLLSIILQCMKKKNMIDYKRLKLALKISNLDKTINNLKNGIETIIGVDNKFFWWRKTKNCYC